MSEDCYDPVKAAAEHRRCVVISGCSGGGKSSLLAALKCAGFAVYEEPGRQIVKEQQFIGGGALPWSDARGFVELAASRALHQRISAGREGRVVFFDRGIIDALSFLEHLGLAVPAHLEAAAQRLRYASTVFMTPPWREIFRNDPQRPHSFEDAVANYASLRRTYQRLGYRLVELPKEPLDTRLRYLVDRLPAACV